MRAAVDARRRAGLQPADAEAAARAAARPARSPADRPRGRRCSSVRPTWILPSRNVPAVSTTARARNAMPICVTTPRDPVALDQQVVDRLLEQRQVRLVLQAAADRRACTARGRPARASRAPPGPCCALRMRNWMPASSAALRHRAAERVDLLDQVALADAADRRVAAHLPERLDVVRQQQRARAHARRRQRGLGAGVAAADHDDVELLGKPHGSARFRGRVL